MSFSISHFAARGSLYAVLILGLAGCITTRSRMKDDSDHEASAPTAVTDSPAHQKAVTDELRQEVSRLSGRVEDLERQNQQLQNQVDKQASNDETKKINSRLDLLEQNQTFTLDQLKKMQSQLPQPDSPALFEKGKEAFEQKDYDEAASTLSQYLKTPNGRFAEEATFYRGESYFHQKEYKKAIVDFSKFPEKYSKSPLMARALLGIAQSFDALGMKEDAKPFFQELADRFGSTKEGKEAKKKLDGPGKGKKGKKPAH